MQCIRIDELFVSTFGGIYFTGALQDRCIILDNIDTPHTVLP